MLTESRMSRQCGQCRRPDCPFSAADLPTVEADTQSLLVDKPFATSEMGDSMDADLLPELSGETWVASALLDELTWDLPTAGANNELVKATCEEKMLQTVQSWVECSAVASLCRTCTGTTLLATTSRKSEIRLVGSSVAPSVALDLTVCPDVFGLRAFDEKLPVTRMLPGASPCDLRLLIPDARIGQDGFHDVVIENLIGTSTWRSRHISPSDVIGLRRRWPQAVFQVIRERCVELEDLRRKAYAGQQPAYRYTGRGYCPVCKIKTEHLLDSHMMCHHLGLGQLWRCPVEWCAVWKGSVRECRDHFNEKHPALREGRITKLISLVNRAMVIAKLTHLRIAIPSSGNPPGEVPSDCFPKTDELGVIKTTKRVSFAPVCQTSMEEVDPLIANQDKTPTADPNGTIRQEIEEPRVKDVREESHVPPPGFWPFEWPQAEWDDIGDVTLDPGLKSVASWSARITEEEMSSPPPLEPLSPIPAENSQDSIMVQVGTPDAEAYTPIVLDRIRSVHRRRSRRPMKMLPTCEKPAPAEDFLFRDIFCQLPAGMWPW